MPSIVADWQNIASKDGLSQLAIKTALCGQWDQAVKINKKILKIDTGDINALNRLGHAYTSLGQKAKAQKIYKQILGIDPYNIIARKNMEKVARQNGQSNGNGNSNDKKETNNPASVFLYEPGKTKIINLLNLAPPAVLCSLNCGDKILFNPKKHAISVTTSDEVYLGALPDDLAHKLLTFIAGGNQYEAYIKSVASKVLTIFIREIFRSEKFFNQPSFQDKRNPYLGEKEHAWT